MTVRERRGRYQEIAGILAAHSLEFVLGAPALSRWRPAARRGRGTLTEHEASARNLRLTLEELGPTFIKIGQLLSTRGDLLPPEYLSELSTLQANAPPVPIAEILQVIAEELGAEASDVFSEFETAPLASASIGQAHAAVLKDGTAVVVKVRRPGAVAQVREDLEIMENLAAQASKHWAAAADYNVIGIADRLARSLREELDYLREGRNADRFAANFDGSDIHIPRIYWETTTSRVLTMERISGIRVDDLQALERAGIDGAGIIRRAVHAMCQMVFDDGFFHADPHPGNLFIEPDGAIGLVDFGMVGSITADARDRLAELFVALSAKDPARVGSATVALCGVKEALDRLRLKNDMAGFIALYDGRELGELDISALISRLLGILRRHRLELQPDIMLLLRMLLVVEGLGARLDPEFALGPALKPYATRLAAERLAPFAIAKRARRTAVEFAALGLDLPKVIRNLAEATDAGGIQMHVRAAELEPLVGRIERVGNRLVIGLIASALIGGIGQLTAGDPSRLAAWGRPLLRAGAGGLGALGAYLAWTSRRRHR